MILFNEYGHYNGPEIPSTCVEDLTAPGPADALARYWRSKLDFEVPRDLATTYLRGFGAWSVEDLAAMSDTDLTETVLWLACGDIKENGEWFGLCS